MNENLTLNQLKAGDAAVIHAYKSRGDVQHRLRELGLVRGTVILVKRFAPLGDPMEICVRGYNLSLRKEDAAQILVRKRPGKED